MLKPDTADWLGKTLQKGKLSRAALARQLCELDGWRNRKGELCAASARKGLPGLAAELGLPLPPARRPAGGCRPRSRRREPRGFPPVRLQCSLEELGAVSLRPADTLKLRRHYGDLLAAEHPLGRGRAPGCRLVYGVRAGGQDVGVVSFVAAPMRLGPRDKHLGWDERTRRRNLPKLVSTSISQQCGDTVSGVTSIDVSNPENIVIRSWRSTPEYGAGIWGRGGVAIGRDGGIYGGTGDGPYNPGRRIFGNTMFRLDPDTLELVDYFTPDNWEYIWKRDFDITASAVVLEYKERELAAIGGKEGVLYLMDTEDMGGMTHHDNVYTTPLLSNDDEWFEGKGLWGGFSSYVDASGKVWLYAPTWGPVSVQAPEFPLSNGPNPNGSVMAFSVADHPETGKPYLRPEWVSGDLAVPEPVVIANDVVFVLANGENVRQTVNAGVFPYGEFNSEELLKDDQRLENAARARLKALDAQTGKTLYDSGPDAFETWSHFTGIAVADGHVYAVDFSSTLYCFGLNDEQ